MRSAWVGGTIAAVALAALTIPPVWPGLGVPVLHHNLSLLVSLGMYAGLTYVGRGDHRRHQALGTALWVLLALVSGFLLLYLKQPLKATGYKDWAKFWHVAWSWLGLWYFIGHTWINRRGLGRALGRWHRTPTAILAYEGVILLILVSIPLTWSTWGARVLQEPQFIPLTWWTWFATVAIAYGLWLYAVGLRRRGRTPAMFGRPAVQGFVDAWLFPMTILANVSGFPILYFGTKDTSLKYVAKYWHVWPSILMAIFLFVHTIQFWPAIMAHWRRRTRR